MFNNLLRNRFRTPLARSPAFEKRELWIRAHSGLDKMPVLVPLLELRASSVENFVLAAAFCARDKDLLAVS